MPVDRERIREQLGQGLGSHEIAHGDRETFFAVLEEEARLAGELGAFEATPANVVMLRDERTLRWEAIAARVFGGVRRVGEVKALYDELKGQGAGTINGTRVQFGFFFNLDGDPGCDPQAPSSLGHSQGLSALANVSGHELSEMLTDPQLNAWYDQKGAENSDKCAWTFNGFVTIGSQSWKIQGNWSNAAALANSGYANAGCIETS
jgi:hypothetical protein